MELKFEDIPNGFEAVGNIPGIGWAQILAPVGPAEATNLNSKPWGGPGDYEQLSGFGITAVPFKAMRAAKISKRPRTLAFASAESFSS